MKAIKIATVFLLILIAAVSWITTDDQYMGVQYLQHLGTLILVLLLTCDIIKGRMPISAFICIAIFALIHIVGARYCYSNVPYNVWFAKLGIDIQDISVNAGRVHANNYDRFVHVAFGFLMFPCLMHKCFSLFERKPLTSVIIAWLFIQTGSMIYEIFEWGLSVVMSPGDAEGYNDQQGDMWDAQKDMACALAGSTIMAIYYLIKEKCKLVQAALVGNDKAGTLHSVVTTDVEKRCAVAVVALISIALCASCTTREYPNVYEWPNRINQSVYEEIDRSVMCRQVPCGEYVAGGALRVPLA